jgi:hypothetical protein
MVLLNMYGKIEPTIISKKLGIGICNPGLDWVEGLQDDFHEEILVYNHKVASFKQSGLDVSWGAGRYDLQNIVEQLGWQEDVKSDMQIIAEHLIEIQVSNFEDSMLQMKNEYMDSPTCEPKYTRKFLDFCRKVQSSKNARNVIPHQIPFSTYDSDDLQKEPVIINYLQVMLHPHTLHKDTVSVYTKRGIDSLKIVGNLIDDFLVIDKDFWLFDYIINALYSDTQQDAYHIFKTMSLIEMLIVNPKGNGKTVGEIEQKLPRFLSDKISQKDRELFSQIMRKLRNKIGHGDFEAVQNLLEQYRQTFMKNFWFDEIEYSIENWTYGDICLRLDEALNEILWLMLFDKSKLVALQMS